MMNWRKPVIQVALRLTRSDIHNNLRTLSNLDRANPATVEHYQRKALKRLCRHAHQTVPYYSEVLEEAGVVSPDGVDLLQFEGIPILTKETLRSEKRRLISTKKGPDPYVNTSGGSTGEPVEFLQDQWYWEWNVASKVFFNKKLGKEIGEPEIKLWGSDRDIFQAESDAKSRLINFLYNRQHLNSFRMSEADMAKFVEAINDVEPVAIWAYVESVHQLATYITEESLDVYSPTAIISTAGTLHEPVREIVQDAFDAPVYNQYGSREVGPVAYECRHQDGMHTFPSIHYVEILDESGNPVGPGEEGDIVITCLTNYSMPLIRYRIGDRGISREEPCVCGTVHQLLDSVTGRIVDHLVTPDGELVHGQYFIHQFYYKDWVRRFQVRQEERDRITVSMVTNGSDVPESDLADITEKIYRAVGEHVNIDFRIVDDIPPSSSGKYRYVISEVDR